LIGQTLHLISRSRSYCRIAINTASGPQEKVAHTHLIENHIEEIILHIEGAGLATIVMVN
jgi:hypothetical protein